MSLQQLAAQHMASQGRGPDTQLVHMSPREVAGLQALAMAQGGSLTINPETGLPEAGFLDKMLPMILGIGATALTGGAAAPWMVGLGVGALQTARTGSLEKGLMAGLGAYGGAGLGAGLMAAGGAGATNAANAAAAAESMGGALAADQAALAGMNAGAPAMSGITGAASAAPTLAADAGAALMQDQAGLAAMKAAPTIPPAAAAQPSIGGGFQQMGRGISALTEPGGREAFMGQAASKGVEATGVGGGMGLLKYGAAAAAPMLMGDTTTKMPEDDKERYNYAFDAGRTEEGYVDPITGQRQYFRPTYRRLADGGPVEEMSNANAIGANTGYPMANIQRNAYAVPYQQPMSENVVTGPQDAAIDPFTGAERMARGGISHLGDYSDGGRLLKGPGDGVSDSIPAMIGNRQPARLADGEFVVPARIVSELGNGSTDAGARKLYAMMDRVQRARGKTTGKNRVAANTRSDKYLPA